MFAVPGIRAERVLPNGSPVRPKKALGVKWSFIAAISLIAAIAVSVCAVAAIVLGSLSLASGVGLPAAAVQFCAALLSGLVAAQLIHIVSECIKTAHHHLYPKKQHVFLR